MCVCVRVRVYIYLLIYIYTHTYTYTYKYMCVSTKFEPKIKIDKKLSNKLNFVLMLYVWVQYLN